MAAMDTGADRRDAVTLVGEIQLDCSTASATNRGRWDDVLLAHGVVVIKNRWVAERQIPLFFEFDRTVIE